MTANDPEISLVICTAGRGQSLARLLASAGELDIPGDLVWEILVVDNSVSGGILEQVKPFAGRLPLRVTREPRMGLSHARNAGLAEARGRYICWTDDDTTLDPAWLKAWRSAFHRHAEADFFGGAIFPRLEAGGPDWFRKCLGDWPLEALTATRRPQTESRVDPADLPWGANFAFRRSSTAGQWFDPALGHGSGRLGEESRFIQQMIGRGATGWWVPECRVTHHIGPERQTMTHLQDYFAQAGASMAYLHDRQISERASLHRRWNPAAASSLTLRTLQALCVAAKWSLHVPGGEKQGVRAAARAHLYGGILQAREQRGQARRISRPAGSVQ